MLDQTFLAPTATSAKSLISINFVAALATAALAVTLGSLAPANARAQDIKGNAAAGAQKNAMCVGCHGIIDYKTGFPDVHRVPKLHGQNARYIATALGEYKQGDRKHPSMRAVAQTLTDQDMADLGAYFESAHAGARTAAAAAPVDAGPAKALLDKAGCPACHGADFNQPIDPAYPKLAGQHSDYLYFALRAYQHQDKAFVGRGNPIMGGMVKQLSNQDLKTLAHYLESLNGDLATIQASRLR
ncbi:MAG: hypothetical protein RL375_4771 [Pseudomonadota bacterium]